MTKMTDPTEISNMSFYDIEMRARQLRAEAARDMWRGLAGYVARLFKRNDTPKKAYHPA